MATSIEDSGSQKMADGEGLPQSEGGVFDIDVESQNSEAYLNLKVISSDWFLFYDPTSF